MTVFWILVQIFVLAGLYNLAGSENLQGYFYSEKFGLEAVLLTEPSSLLLASLVAILGLAVQFYCLMYFKDPATLRRALGFLMLFELPMVLLCLSGDWITLFLCFEAISVASFALIAFQYEDTVSRERARSVLMLSVGSGLSLLTGLLLVSSEAGGSRLSAIGPGHMSGLAAGLIVLGAGIKSAQFPFHFWLPSAMSAPTPASAYLHSATLVKAGFVVLMKLQGALEFQPAMEILALSGAFTAMLSSCLALIMEDMKASLAYSTLAALGVLGAVLGSSHPEAVSVATLFFLLHASYKAPWFLHLGYAEKVSGTRLWARFSSSLSWAGYAVGLLIVFLMMGLISTKGQTAKAAVLGVMQAYEWPLTAWFLWISFLLTGVLGLRYLYATLPGRRGKWLGKKDWMSVPSLAVVLIWWGLSPEFIYSRVGEAPQSLGPAGWLATFKSALVPGALILTALGARLNVVMQVFYPFSHEPVLKLFDRLIVFLPTISNTLNNFFISSRPHQNLRTLLATVVIFLLVPLGYVWDGWPQINRIPADSAIVFLVLVSCLCAFSILLNPARLPTLLALSGIGLAQTLMFFYLGALDAATTQLLVETLGLFVMAVVFMKMEAFEESEAKARGGVVLRGLIGLGGGLALYLCTAFVLTSQPVSDLQDYFMAKALPEGYGMNVVNVILVDFRALDTLGEVFVLAATAMSLGLLFQSSRKQEKHR